MSKHHFALHTGTDVVEILPTDEHFCEDCSYEIGLNSAGHSSFTVSVCRGDEGCEESCRTFLVFFYYFVLIPACFYMHGSRTGLFLFIFFDVVLIPACFYMHAPVRTPSLLLLVVSLSILPSLWNTFCFTYATKLSVVFVPPFLFFNLFTFSRFFQPV